MKSVGVHSGRAAARLWSIAAGVAAVDVGVALEMKPDTVVHFMVVLALCAAMAVWSRLSLAR